MLSQERIAHGIVCYIELKKPKKKVFRIDERDRRSFSPVPSL